MSVNHSIIYFDGVCNLCNSFISFVIDRDRQRKFCYVSLQSEPGKQVASRNNYPTEDLESILLMEDNLLYDMSTAVLRIFRKLGG